VSEPRLNASNTQPGIVDVNHILLKSFKEKIKCKIFTVKCILLLKMHRLSAGLCADSLEEFTGKRIKKGRRCTSRSYFLSHEKNPRRKPGLIFITVVQGGHKPGKPGILGGRGVL